MTRWIYAVTASVALLAAGVVHGFWTDRWVSDTRLSDATARLADVPMRVGDWEGSATVNYERVWAADAAGEGQCAGGVESTASVLGGTFARIQFTPDLVPSDLVGTRIFRPDRHEFDTELGPVFCNFLLADEINRAPAQV